jgi:CheY-like chemotaxis protein
VGAFQSGEEALRDLPKLEPNVVLMDINLPGMSGIECIRRLKAANSTLQIMMLTVFEDHDRIFDSLSAGASGYLCKSGPLEQLARHLSEVTAGNPFLMDNVPIFARRSVLLNYETSLPLYPTYARAIDHRTRALVDAYFGWSDEALLVLVRTMRVSHLVVSRSDFAGGTPWAIEPWSRVPVGSGEPYMAPYRAEIKRRLAAKPPAVPWAWERAAAQATVWENEAFIVLDLGRE